MLEHLVFFFVICSFVYCKEIIELGDGNLNIGISSFDSLVVLFHDRLAYSMEISKNFTLAASSANISCDNCALAVFVVDSVVSREIVTSLGLPIPSIASFRREMMNFFFGSYDLSSLVTFFETESSSSIKLVVSSDDLYDQLRSAHTPSVLAIFPDEEMIFDYSDSPFNPWFQYQLTADTLRKYISFYATSLTSFSSSFSSMSNSFGLFLITEEGIILEYLGEFDFNRITTWILDQIDYPLLEISRGNILNDFLANHFFNSQETIFILLLSDFNAFAQSETRQAWSNIYLAHKKQAMFAVIDRWSMPDVGAFFHLDQETDLPIVVAYRPSDELSFASSRLNFASDRLVQDMSTFVTSVLNGSATPVIKSQPIPTHQNSHVIDLVGLNVLEVVNNPDIDVLLEVYSPAVPLCNNLRSMMDILGLAVKEETRIVIAKIDGTANSIPMEWEVKSYPTFMFFSSHMKKKWRDINLVKPIIYSGTTYTAFDLMDFIYVSTSFASNSLRLATVEQLDLLMQQEEALKLKYKQLDHHIRRNEARYVYSRPWLDYWDGEIVYDGKRWHWMAWIGMLVVWPFLVHYVVQSCFSCMTSGKKRLRKAG